MTNYVITGVWFKANQKGTEHISHVMLHSMSGNSIVMGKKTDKDTVVSLLGTNTIMTLKWNYRDGSWTWGAKVSYETRDRVNYLRTVPDGDVTNNLDNLINMSVFPF